MRFRTIGLISTLALGLLGAPLLADARQAGKVYRIGFLNPTCRAAPVWLRTWDYIEGKIISFEHRFAAGRDERLPELAAELARLKVDVIVTEGTPATRAAKQATQTIPIVMLIEGDPVRAGLVASLARPGGNITGLSSVGSDLVGKQLELFKEAVPRLSRVAVLRNPAHRGHPRAVRLAEVAARALGLRLVVIDVGSAAGLPGAFRRMVAEGADGALVLPGGLFVSNRTRIAELAVKAALPTMFGHQVEAEAGGLMSYGTDRQALFRRAAAFVDKILKGRKPADLPIEWPTKFELVINLKTAKQLGLTIPSEVLFRADKVIK